ncbi:hypothetical protein [Sessilibacter corallicola]|uniref:hypothetical protein n=1 Tax=Sessilibacter corallicola TaxID=2904075 RepID=UPI001E2D5E84|nr:hypothetical protein [Sessilibacter corallicola]MCE2026836.1 hypothetical protein [Sessilibacter corallicola]
MKVFFTALLVVVSFSAMADEPSAEYQCKENFQKFRLGDEAQFDLCPVGNNSFNIDITSVGGNYHTCWWNTKSYWDGEKHVAKEGNCEVNFLIQEDTLHAKFTGDCRSYCGFRARLRDGTYELVLDTAEK